MSVKLNPVKYLLVLTALLVGTQVFANRIDRGYEALSQFDYFKAKKLFSKGLKYNKTAASQGLAIIYYRTDNPFHNYDSALFYIQQSIEGWDMEKSRRKEKYAQYGFNEDSLHSIRNAISAAYFATINDDPSIEDLTGFIDVHTWAKERPGAIAVRDSMAFFNAVEMNSSSAYKSFADTYSKSAYAEMAMDNYYNSQFLEQTSTGNLTDFESFVEQNPDSPLKREAEANIFKIVTEKKDKASFERFIATYPNSSFIDSAWVGLFHVHISNYSKESMDEFMMTYPENPISDYITKEQLFFDSLFLPTISEGKFGFMSLSGSKHIESKYDYAGFYREGLAIVAQKDKYGFIDKFDRIRVPFVYSSASEFKDGRAIVELDDKIGMIDRNGHFVFDCIYDDISALSEGLSYADMGGKYGYYNQNGELVIPHAFDDAYEFKDSMALVEVEGKQGFIDHEGEYVVKPCYERVSHFYDTLFTFQEDGLFGIMNHKCQIFVEPKFAHIGTVKKGLALAALDDRVVYLDTLGHFVVDDKYQLYPNYLLKGEFNGEYAIVRRENKYGRINTNNEQSTPAKFENIGLGEEYYPAQLDGRWGLFNKMNESVIAPEYESVQLIDDKYLIVFKNDTSSVLGVNGEVIVPAMFEEIEHIYENLFMVKQKGKIGVYQDTRLVVPVAYEQIGQYDANFLFLSRSGVLHYLYIPDQKVIREAKDE